MLINPEENQKGYKAPVTDRVPLNGIVRSVRPSKDFALGVLASCLFLCLPFAFSLEVFDPAQLSIMIAAYLLILATYLFFFLRYRPGFISFGLCDALWVGYSVFSGISLLRTHDSPNGILEICRIVLFYILLKLFQLFLLSDRHFIEISSFSIAINCIVQCGLAILQKQLGISLFGSVNGFLGTMTHPNVFSESLFFSLPFLILGILYVKWPYRIIPTISFVLCIVCLITTKTRSVWVGFGLAAFISACYFAKFRTTNMFRVLCRNYRVHIYLVSASIILPTAMLIAKDWVDFKAHLLSIFTLQSSDRFYLWRATMHVLLESPIWGVGLGDWRFHIPVLNHIAFQRPHNDFLWVLSESGIFSLVCYVGFFILVLLNAITDKTKSLRDIFQQTCVSFGIVGFLVDSFFSFPKERPYLLVLIAFLTALASKRRGYGFGLHLRANVFVALAIISSSGGLYFCCNRYRNERELKALLQNYHSPALLKLGLIQAIDSRFCRSDPYSNPIALHEGLIQIELGDIDEAKICFQRAYQIAPLNPDVLINLGSLHEMTSERTSARKYYTEAIKAEPCNTRAMLNLAVIEYKDGNREAAEEYIERIDPRILSQADDQIAQHQILKSSLNCKR